MTNSATKKNANDADLEGSAVKFVIGTQLRLNDEQIEDWRVHFSRDFTTIIESYHLA